MKLFFYAIALTALTACSGSSGSGDKSSDESPGDIEGTWATSCTSYSLRGVIALSGYYIKSIVFTASESTATETVYSDAACSTQTSSTPSTSTYTLGEDVAGVAGATEIDFESTGNKTYDIVKVTTTTLTLGKKDQNHDGRTPEKRPSELNSNVAYTRKDKSATTGGNADCGSISNATVTYTLVNSTYTGFDDSKLVCGSYSESITDATSISFDVEVASRSTVQGSHAPVNLGFSGYPAVAGTTYDCDITFDDGDGTVMVNDDSGTCGVTIEEVSGGSISGTFTATKLVPLNGTATAESVEGTFSIE